MDIMEKNGSRGLVSVHGIIPYGLVRPLRECHTPKPTLPYRDA